MNSIAEGVECEAQLVPRTQSDSGGTHPTGQCAGNWANEIIHSALNTPNQHLSQFIVFLFFSLFPLISQESAWCSGKPSPNNSKILSLKIQTSFIDRRETESKETWGWEQLISIWKLEHECPSLAYGQLAHNEQSELFAFYYMGLCKS